MPINTAQEPLKVIEASGDPRSGKGSIVSHLETLAPTIATEETGADYRVVTLALLNDGKLERGMDKAAVAAVVGKIPLGQLTDWVASRKTITAENGTDILYTEAVADLVGSVSPNIPVRKAVKAGFKQRVLSVVKDESKHTLVVDGRNLAAVVSEIEETELVMSFFLKCAPWEGARREVARNKSLRDASREEIQAALELHRKSIEKRMKDDTERDVDPVVPDRDAIDYWWETKTNRLSQQRYADLYFGGDQTAAVMAALSHGGETPVFPRYGVGTLAVRSGRQILFDTTNYNFWFPDDPRGHMVRDTERMFAEGLTAYHEQRDLRQYEDELVGIHKQ